MVMPGSHNPRNAALAVAPLAKVIRDELSHRAENRGHILAALLVVVAVESQASAFKDDEHAFIAWATGMLRAAFQIANGG